MFKDRSTYNYAGDTVLSVHSNVNLLAVKQARLNAPIKQVKLSNRSVINYLRKQINGDKWYPAIVFDAKIDNNLMTFVR